jgi:hypothetical protein
MNDTAALERRYRRLLACYPTDYRAEYGEEMIGVLMDSTPADQDRPTKADTFDLIGGGMLARFRLLRVGHGDEPWRNTLAVFSVIAPVILFATVAGAWADTNLRLDRFATLDYRYNNRVDELAIVGAIGLVAVVICPLLARRGRAAATTGTAIGVIAVASAVIAMIQFIVDLGTYAWDSYLAMMLAVELVALVASPGPRQGWQLLGRKGLIILVATAVVLAISAGLRLAGFGQGTNGFGLGDLANSVDEITPLVGVALIAVRLRWPAGGRLLALFAIPGYLLSGFNAVQWLISYVYPMYWYRPTLAAEIEYVPVAAIAALIAVAAWRSSRRRRPRIPGTTG